MPFYHQSSFEISNKANSLAVSSLLVPNNRDFFEGLQREINFHMFTIFHTWTFHQPLNFKNSCVEHLDPHLCSDTPAQLT